MSKALLSKLILMLNNFILSLKSFKYAKSTDRICRSIIKSAKMNYTSNRGQLPTLNFSTVWMDRLDITMKNLSNFNTDFSITNSNFLLGAATVFNVAGGFYEITTSESSIESDWEVIGNDFKVVGNDLRSCLSEG
ncbi:MAG: hypothetical protein ACO1NS_02090 [Daejeonella sp.]